MRTILCAVGFVLILLGTGVRSQSTPSFWEKVVDWLPKLRHDATKFLSWHTHNTKFVCEQDGFFPDEIDCTLFYHCVQVVTNNYMRNVFKCNDDYVYSIKNESCVRPEDNDRPECVEYINKSKENEEQKNGTEQSEQVNVKDKSNGIDKAKPGTDPSDANEEEDGASGQVDSVMKERRKRKTQIDLANVVEDDVRGPRLKRFFLGDGFNVDEGCGPDDTDDYGECDTVTPPVARPPVPATHLSDPKTTMPPQKLYTSDDEYSSSDGSGTSHSTDTDCTHLLDLVTGALFSGEESDESSSSLSDDRSPTSDESRIKQQTEVTVKTPVAQFTEKPTSPPRSSPVRPGATEKPEIQITVTTLSVLRPSHSTPKPDDVQDLVQELTTKPTVKPGVIDDLSDSKESIELKDSEVSDEREDSEVSSMEQSEKSDDDEDSRNSISSAIRNSDQEWTIEKFDSDDSDILLEEPPDSFEISDGTKELDEVEDPGKPSSKKDSDQESKTETPYVDDSGIPKIGQPDLSEISDDIRKSEEDPRTPSSIRDSDQESKTEAPDREDSKIPTLIYIRHPDSSEISDDIRKSEEDSRTLSSIKDSDQESKTEAPDSEDSKIPTLIYIRPSDSSEIFDGTEKPSISEIFDLGTGVMTRKPEATTVWASITKPSDIARDEIFTLEQIDSSDISDDTKKSEEDPRTQSSIKDSDQESKTETPDSEDSGIPTVGQFDSSEMFDDTKKSDEDPRIPSSIKDSDQESKTEAPDSEDSGIPTVGQFDSSEMFDDTKKSDEDPRIPSSIKDSDQESRTETPDSEDSEIPTMGQFDSFEISDGTEGLSISEVLVSGTGIMTTRPETIIVQELTTKPIDIARDEIFTMEEIDSFEISDSTAKPGIGKDFGEKITTEKETVTVQELTTKPSDIARDEIFTMEEIDSSEISDSTEKPSIIEDLGKGITTTKPETTTVRVLITKPSDIGRSEIFTMEEIDSSEISDSTAKLGKTTTDALVEFTSEDEMRDTIKSGVVPTVKPIIYRPYLDDVSDEETSDTLEWSYMDYKSEASSEIPGITTRPSGRVDESTLKPSVTPVSIEDLSLKDTIIPPLDQADSLEIPKSTPKPSIAKVLHRKTTGTVEMTDSDQEPTTEPLGVKDTIIPPLDQADSLEIPKSTLKPDVTKDLHKVITGTVEMTDSDQELSTVSTAKPDDSVKEVTSGKPPGPKDVEIHPDNRTKLFELSRPDVQNLINVFLHYDILVPDRYYSVDDLNAKFDKFATVLMDLIKTVGYGTGSDGTIKIPSVTAPGNRSEEGHETCIHPGYFPNTVDCSKFYRCIPFGSRYLRYDFQCRVGTIWDARINTCNFPANVPRNGTCTRPSYSTLDGAKFSHGHVPKRTCFHCPSGIERHPEYCNIFYQCAVDEHMQIGLTTFACPPNTIFARDNEGRAGCLSKLIVEKTDNCIDFDLHGKSIKIIDLKPEKSTCSDVGRFPFSDDCSSTYLKCVQLEGSYFDAYLRDCPPGKVFSSLGGRCVEARSVGC